MDIIAIAFVAFLVLLIAQGALVIYLNLYAWLDPDRLTHIGSPSGFLQPKSTFSVLLPAYKEEAVLGATITQVGKLNYPSDLYEILVILQPSDKGTLKVAKEAIIRNKLRNAKIIIVDGSHEPLNKPYQLNTALDILENEYLVIFDSEDEVHKDILNIANTLYSRLDVDIIQCGVQLMNYASNWFAAHNVLEYYFWFKSRMHAHMKIGAVPLGGNSVFFRSSDVRGIGGWNENCLCEDADIGLRLSIEGSNMIATYDSRHITKEETPHSVSQFIKQRTRWCQGFIQILRYGYWRKLGSFPKVIMSLYLLGSPFILVSLVVMGIVMAFVGVFRDMPFAVSILSFLPLFMVLSMIFIQMGALYEFAKEHSLRINPLVFLAFPFTFIPYVVLLVIGAVRAAVREFKGQSNWEKTDHHGLHRKEASL